MNLEYRVVRTLAEKDAIHKLRYQVYCVKTQYLDARDYPDERERDEYDPYCTHIIVPIVNDDGVEEIGGYVRLIHYNRRGFPAEQLSPTICTPVKEDTVESSRFIVSPSVTGQKLMGEIMITLLGALYTECKKSGHRYVYSVVEQSLADFFLFLKLTFRVTGRPSHHMGGKVYPILMDLEEIEETLSKTNSRLSRFVGKPVEKQSLETFA